MGTLQQILSALTALVLTLQGSFSGLPTQTQLAAIGQTPGFVNTTLITGLTEPTTMAFTPDSRMLIVGRRGIIWVVQPGATQVDATPFLQLSSGQVAFDNERGLLGLTLDPNFSSNGYYYIFYTESSSNKNRVSRLTATGNTTSLSTETLVWRNSDVTDIYHQGGSMAFGPDGYLYVSDRQSFL